MVFLFNYVAVFLLVNKLHSQLKLQLNKSTKITTSALALHYLLPTNVVRGRVDLLIARTNLFRIH